MVRLNPEEGRYRVLLLGIGNNTKEEKSSFCQNISKHYSIPSPLLEKIVDRCPVILKKNISLIKAEILAKSFKFFGASVSIEERKNIPPISLQFQELVPHRLALESSYLQKTQRGTWSVMGRIKNISDETLNDTWVLIQLFEDLGEFIAFEETPLPINPLPPRETSPFKVIFDGDLSIKRVSVAFKNASGQPISAVDERKKKEWVEVAIGEEGFLSSRRMVTEFKKRAKSVDLTKPSEKILISKDKAISAETPLSLEQVVGVQFEKEMRESKGGDAERISEDSLSETFEPLEKVLESSVSLFEENSYPRGEEPEIAFRQETFEESALPASEKMLEKIEIEEEAALDGLEVSSFERKVAEESRLDASVLEEPAQLLKDISESPGEGESEEEEPEERVVVVKEEAAKEKVVKEKGVKEKEVGTETGKEEEVSSFAWIEYFRNAVETYHQKPHDIFSIWFKECRERGEFRNSFHALLTLLVHSRFDQGNESIKVLENTQRVFRFIVPPNLSLDEMPLLEGTSFASGEVWRDLFHRALPKVQQIGNAVLEKNKWKAFDLERLIQIIPHMGHQNSRKAAQWIGELISDMLEVDFSDTPVAIGEGLYRVASRLGIVDPHLDYYQGRNSIGDAKIQSFSKTAFPQNPIKIEEPMAWMGKEEERGGHCFPIQPWCEGCLFETFCPRFHVDFNPSEKGMRE
jgi:hypothetical protein